MKYKYQIVFLGNLGEISEGILELIYEKIEELKLLKDSFEIITDKNFSRDYKRYQPTYCVYFSDKDGSQNNIDIVNSLIKDATMILPVFHNSFSKEIPKALENQNGLKYDSSKNEKIVNLILESFGKLRNTRKVFVSYKRDESTSVAIQLFEALEKNNFDVFLDTHSIIQGEKFQEELWHRMTDCDVIVLLNTKKFLNSFWCKEEIAEASAKQIGVIQLVWPYNKLERMAEVCLPLKLKKSNFKDGIFNSKDYSKLNADFVSELIRKVESVRARNLASRQDSLINEFINIAEKNKKK